jgi:penicillin-binding protein 1A
MSNTSSGVPIKRRHRNADKKNIRSASFVLLSVFFVLALTLIIVLTVTWGYIVSVKNGEPKIDLDSYKNSQDQTSIIYAYDSNNKPVEIATLHGTENRIWVSIDTMPKSLQHAFVALEDKRFYTHHGVDWKRTIGAIVKYHLTQGGSTITQQLIKNLTDENQVSFARKFNEILYALNLEQNYSKNDILEAYLNTIPLGSGCYGVQTASQKYFGKDVKDLTIAECATLAAITKAPTKYNPLLHPENNKKRRDICLKAMYDQGYITKSEYEQAVNEDIVFTNSKNYVASGDTEETTAATDEDNKINSWYVDYVIDSVIDDFEASGYSKSEAVRLVYYGGLKIYSAEDIDVQAKMDDIYTNRTAVVSEPTKTETGDESGNNKKVQSAMIVLDYTGRVVGLEGGLGPKTVNRGYNRATDAKRQPGSSIKPLSCYAPAMEKGQITYYSKIENYAIVVNGELWPQNYGGSKGESGSYVTTQYAVAHSLNTTAVRVLKKYGVKNSLNFMIKKLHFTTLVTEGANTDANLSSLGVGGMSYGVKPIEMAAAYEMFGNGGYYYAPYCYYKVTNYSGDNVYLTKKSTKEKVISPNTAETMNKIMQTVVTEGTGVGYGVKNFTTFMKTGTTSDNRDKWCCGGTPYYVAACWYGYDANDVITNAGGNPAGRQWAAVMNAIHQGLDSTKDFNYSDITDKGLITTTASATTTAQTAETTTTAAATTASAAE